MAAIPVTGTFLTRRAKFFFFSPGRVSIAPLLIRRLSGALIVSALLAGLQLWLRLQAWTQVQPRSVLHLIPQRRIVPREQTSALQISRRLASLHSSPVLHFHPSSPAIFHRDSAGAHPASPGSVSSLTLFSSCLFLRIIAHFCCFAPLIFLPIFFSFFFQSFFSLSLPLSPASISFLCHFLPLSVKPPPPPPPLPLQH